MNSSGLLDILGEEKQLRKDFTESLKELGEILRNIQEEYKVVKHSDYIQLSTKYLVMGELMDKFNETKEEIHNLVDEIEID